MPGDDIRAELAALRASIEKSIEASHQNAVALASIQTQVTMLNENRASGASWLETIGNRLSLVENTLAGMKAERGVFSAIVRSPFVAWASAALAGVWAYISHVR